MAEMYAEDVLFDVSAVFTDIAPMRGKENVRSYWYELRETWEGLRLDPVEVLDVGDGRYVAELRLWGKGKRSGAEVEESYAFLTSCAQMTERSPAPSSFRASKTRSPRRSHPPPRRSDCYCDAVGARRPKSF